MEIKMLYGEKITAAFFPLPGIMRITGGILCGLRRRQAKFVRRLVWEKTEYAFFADPAGVFLHRQQSGMVVSFSVLMVFFFIGMKI